MKKITYLLLASLFVLTSCQQEDEIFDTAAKDDTNEEKVDICHKGKKTININVDSIQDHLDHGDVLGECSDDPNVNYTFVPDNNFEQALIDLGYDDELDNLVLTSQINSVTFLSINNLNISDLTGIEGFESLVHLRCQNNQLTEVDLSNNTALSILEISNNQLVSLDVSNNKILKFLYCRINQITSLDISTNEKISRITCDSNNLVELNLKNGNNVNFSVYNALNNPNLTCIQVDDISYSEVNWLRKDATASYSEDCGF